MLKKLMAVTGMALLLAGCAAQSDASSPSDSPSPDASETTPTPTPEEAFLSEFHATNPDADRGTDQQWLDLANSVCSAYDAGASPNQVVDSMQGSSLDANEAASIVVLSAQYLCPEYYTN